MPSRSHLILVFQQTFARRFAVRVVTPVTLGFLAVVLIVTGGLYSAGREVDDLSMEGQNWEAFRAIGRSLDEIALAQESTAVCSECLAAVEDGPRGRAFIEEHIARPLYALHHVEETFIIDSAGTPVFSSMAGRPAPAEAWQRAAPAVMPHVLLARGLLRQPNNLNQRLPGMPLHRFSAVRTSEQAIHSTDLARVRGRPAIVSVMRMIPAGVRGSAQGPLLVGIRYLDDGWVREIARHNFILSPRVSMENDAGEDERAVPIQTSGGKLLGYLVWKPLLPGSMLVAALSPSAISSLALLGLMLVLASWLVGKMMWRDERRLARLRQAHVELLASESHAHHLAYHDPLTGLPNRALFNDTAEKALARMSPDEPMAIILLDIDRFKHINDRYGHLAGDALIQEVARRLCRIAGDAEMVARLGGDEFAILLRYRNDLRIADRLQAMVEEMRRPFELLGNQAHAGISIGVALTPHCGADRTELMRKADIALYRAKGEGRDCYRFFSEEMDETVQLRASLETDLRKALANGQELEVHYQPQVDARSGAVTGLEALLRWNHPQRGQVPPSQFVPIAEETGLISALGDLVLRDACAVARSRPLQRVAVNLSAVQFRDEGLPQHIAGILAEEGVTPDRIELEVTEGVLLDDSDMVHAMLRRLRAMGFTIALDDFGTGYSSLSYLRKFEVDRIKIDKSFVQRLGSHADAEAIVTAVITLGHAMGLKVTAEGVETVEQQRYLQEAGCTELQGHLFSRAMPAGALPQYRRIRCAKAA